MTSYESIADHWSRFKWNHIICVVAGVMLGTLIRFPFQPLIHDASPFFFYIPVVMALALILGKQCGLYATMLSVLPANYYWMAPEHTLAINLGELFQILGFSFAGFSISWVSDEVRKHKQLEEHLRATLASLVDAVVTTDCSGRIVYLNSVAQVLLDRDGQELTGCMLADTLGLMTDDGGNSLYRTFQAAISNDDIEHLPRQVILIGRTGKRQLVKLNASRILDAKGRKLGTAIVFNCLESDTKTELIPCQQ